MYTSHRPLQILINTIEPGYKTNDFYSSISPCRWLFNSCVRELRYNCVCKDAAISYSYNSIASFELTDTQWNATRAILLFVRFHHSLFLARFVLFRHACSYLLEQSSWLVTSRLLINGEVDDVMQGGNIAILKFIQTFKVRIQSTLNSVHPTSGWL